MTNMCCCDDTSFLDTSPQFTRRRRFHHNLTVVQSEEHGVEVTFSKIVDRQGGYDSTTGCDSTIEFLPREVRRVWFSIVFLRYPRDAPSRTGGLSCLQWGLLFCMAVSLPLTVPICLFPFCIWTSDYYLEARRLDHFRRYHLPPGYRVEITHLSNSSCFCGCLPRYQLRMYVSQEVYEAAAEEDPAYQERMRNWEREQHNEQRRRDQERAQHERQQDRLLSRPEARQQVSSLRESTVEEVLTSCDLNHEELAYAQRFRQEGVTSVQLLCELTYEDLGFMRAGDRRRLFIYLHPQESVTRTQIKRAILVPPASIVCVAPSTTAST
mmetsp:Transcript_1132/g.3495  ORF Transcript_1132/g.3495 Transcript_1132/m.3495 type:complete len:324 (-) Transcript_1132:55-1026(-)